jgi:hypothetical protein
MAVDKDFVIRNGIQVNENLIYADANSDKIGIGTTTPDKKLVIIGDTEVSKQLAVGTTISAQRLVTTGVSTSNIGLDVGVGGTVFTSSTLTKKVGINSAIPAYTLDVIGPVSIGQTAEYVYGDLTVTGNIKGTSLTGQISAGGTVGFTNVTVDNNLVANDAEIFTKFTLEEVNSDTFRFLTAGDPPGIGFTQNTDDPELYLIRGNKYEFHVDSGGFPFYIKTAPTADLDNIYSNGVDGNGTQVGILTIRVPFNAPNKLFYQASNVAGMGATIYLNNNGKQIDVGVATVRERLDSNGYADFENIYVSGIGTINNIKSNNFSVSAGIVTVRQDQTAIIGVSTGADRVSVQTTSSSATHQVSFVNNVGLGSNYPLHLIDSDTNQLTYVPSTNVLSCTRFVGNVSGIATGADNINVDPQNGNTDYQVIFSNPGEYDYKRMYIDSESSRLTYNPSLNRLSVTNIIATSITGGLIGTATRADLINVDEQSGNTNYQILFSDNQGANYQRPYIDTDSTKLLYNPSTNTLQSTNIIATTVTAGLAGTATRADFINVDEKNDNTNYQVLFSTNQGAGYQRPYIDSDSGKFIYNPSTNTLTADNLAGRGDNLTNLDGSNISQGLINEARLPNATTSAQGVVQLDNTYPPTSTSTTRTATTNVSTQLYTAIQTLISSGSKMLFYQAAAPVGWTKLTTDNNKTLRVVSGSGGGSGGTNTFTSAFSERSVPVPTHNHNANAGDQSANHTHGGEAVSANANHSHNGNAAYENVPHNHGINAGSANGRFLSGINWSKGDFDSDGGKEAIINIGYNKQDVGYSNPNVRQGNAAHSHSVSTNAANATHGHNLSINAQNADHQHAITVASAGTGNNMDFRVQYIDVIVCKKN